MVVARITNSRTSTHVRVWENRRMGVYQDTASTFEKFMFALDTALWCNILHKRMFSN